MKLLLTGASSFTGCWFAETLAAAGHAVTAPLTQALSAYQGLRARRLERVGRVARLVPHCAFGSDAFLTLAGEGFDVLCHHGAVVADYRNPDFDEVAALGGTVHRMRHVLAGTPGLKAVVATGSVFEGGEGTGEAPLRAFSAYGLSKQLSAAAMAFRCEEAGLPLFRFVIANPFGPWEEPRFCAHLLASWRAGRVAEVRTPAYLRDNIHVDLLALAYAGYVAAAGGGTAPARFGPQGYCETQGAFAQRFAREIGPRLDLATPLALAEQTAFPEPRIRLNVTPIDPARYGWTEATAWDRLAAFYAVDT